MEAEFDSDLTLTQLAAESGYSRTHFLRMFRGATGQSPHRYLLELRLKKAASMLARRSLFLMDITMDGCCDHTKVIADDEILEYFTQLMGEFDLQVFGRKTYQLMVPYWPEVAKDPSATKADHEFAEAFDSVDKLVFSRSLDSGEDGNTRIVRTNPQDEILRLKQQPGKNFWSAASIFLHNLWSSVSLTNTVLWFRQSLQERADGCWKASACARVCA
jgi:AraC-like DNA-binding protein